MSVNLTIMVLYLSIGLCVVATPAPGELIPTDKQELDGTWTFQMDPDDIGESSRWFSPDATFEASIEVPGAWDAQGFGEETEKLRHQFIGKAWYQRTATVPEGERRFLCIGGIHRYAKVWVNGHYLGEHIGYLSPFEYEVTDIAPAGSIATVTIRVDSEQNWDIDALMGCFDIMDKMHTPWGGIWGHVAFEGRPEAYLSDIFVEPRISPTGCKISAQVNGPLPADASLLLKIEDVYTGKVVAEQNVPALVRDGRVVMDVEVPDAALWTPETPSLYRASLLRKMGTDTSAATEGSGEVPVPTFRAGGVTTRFGFRTIETDGYKLLLNGKRVFLCGYGDDAIYPATMAAPCDKQFYRDRIAFAKKAGFNHVRHHSHLLPPEYYDACDELGILVSAEFAIGYKAWYNRAGEAALDLYQSEWAAVIKRFRNHPAIMDWCIGNELLDAIPIAEPLYRVAKELDPTRLVIDSDGVRPKGLVDGTSDRDWTDFYVITFSEYYYHAGLGRDDGDLCPSPNKPVLSHETGNFVTFPRLGQIERFKDNVKPFWLIETRDKLARLGLLNEADLWAYNSEQLYQLLHKTNIEAIRKRETLSGYHWWLLQDYWTSANGIVDFYFEPKPGIELDVISRMNSDVVVLQEGLSPVYRSGQTATFALLISNFSPEVLERGTVSCELRSEGSVSEQETLNVPDIPQGEVVSLGAVELEIPTVATPTRKVIKVMAHCGTRTIENEWTVWLYPATTPAPKTEAKLVCSPEMLPWLGPWGVERLPFDAVPPAGSVCFATRATPELIEGALAGASVILLKPYGLLPTAPTRFKTAWWKGDEQDNSAGTVVYDYPAIRAMAPDGWCDASWQSLVEGSEGYVLDDVPSVPDVLVRGIEIGSVCRNKGLLVEARVGRGRLMVCGLNLRCPLPDNSPNPAAAWLMARIIEHAADGPMPRAELSEEFLRERITAIPQFDPPYVEGYARLIRLEGEKYNKQTYREELGPILVMRQSSLDSVVEWETAPMPADITSETVTLVFAGGTGWHSQPETDGFVLSVDGKNLIQFDIFTGFAHWSDQSGKADLYQFPQRIMSSDTLALYYLRLPVTMISLGKPLSLSVRSLGAGSKRWFGLNPYTDVIGTTETTEGN